MGNYILCFIFGALIMWGLIRWELYLEYKRIRRQAEMAARPDEVIETYNATVLTDEHGNISWIDNDRKIKVYKAKE